MGDYADGKPYGGHQAHRLIVQADEQRMKGKWISCRVCGKRVEAGMTHDGGATWVHLECHLEGNAR